MSGQFYQVNFVEYYIKIVVTCYLNNKLVQYCLAKSMGTEWMDGLTLPYTLKHLSKVLRIENTIGLDTMIDLFNVHLRGSIKG